MTCLADWAAMRPNSIGGSGSVTKSPSLAASFLRLGVLELDLAAGLLDALDDFEQAPHAQSRRCAGLISALDLGLGAVAGLGRLLDGVLHRLDHDHAVDRLFAGNGICDLQQLEAVRANGHLVWSPRQRTSSSSIVGSSAVLDRFDLVVVDGMLPGRAAPFSIRASVITSLASASDGERQAMIGVGALGRVGQA